MPATSPLHVNQPGNTSLCPVCGSKSIRIKTDVEVEYDVIFEATAKDFRVVDEVLGDSMWDARTQADCPSCRWHGTVGELRQGPNRHERPAAS